VSSAPSRNTAARTWRRLAGALGAALLLTAPVLLLGDYQLFRLTLVAIYALALLGLNLVMGYGGQISLGHGAFYAVGAYATAIPMTMWGVPYWATLPVAAVICAALGFLVGWPALRLRGHYLALVTLALATAVPQILKHKALEPWTGGVQGVLVSKPDPPFGLPLSQDQWLYLVALLVVAAAFALVRNLLHGRVGRAIVATRDNALAAEAMGINLAALKTRTFALSAALTGVAGALGALAVEFVAPDSFPVVLSITLFVGSVVGGAASLVSAVAGACFVVFVPPLAGSVSKAAPGAVYGALLILCLYAMPAGVAGLLRGLWNRRPRRKRAAVPVDAPEVPEHREKERDYAA
jgi:branched-chain amino acid transport system permease protein